MEPRFALLGAGVVAELYAKAFERGLPACFAGVFDPVSEKAVGLARRLQGRAYASRAELLATAGLVTIIDGSPATLSWLGGVLGQRVSSLGTDSFGQVGDLPDLYHHYRLDVDAIIEACADLFLVHA